MRKAWVEWNFLQSLLAWCSISKVIIIYECDFFVLLSFVIRYNYTKESNGLHCPFANSFSKSMQPIYIHTTDNLKNDLIAVCVRLLCILLWGMSQLVVHCRVYTHDKIFFAKCVTWGSYLIAIYSKCISYYRDTQLYNILSFANYIAIQQIVSSRNFQIFRIFSFP